MKNISLIIVFLCSFQVYSQAKEFTFDKNGLTKFVVIDLDSLKSNEIYQKTINWVKDNYKKPDAVFDATIENQSVRFTGIASAFRIYNAFGDFVDFPIEYTIKVSIKDNKYKFEVIEIDVKHDRIDYSDIPKVIYKKNGALIKWYRDTPKMIENYFNNLNKSLANYITDYNNSEGW